MIVDRPDKLLTRSKILAACDLCDKRSSTLYKCYRRSIVRYGLYRCFECATRTDEFRNKSKINAKLSRGKHGPMSVETKKKLSDSIKLTMTAEKRAAISCRSKALWANESFRNRVGDKLSRLWKNKEIREKAILGIKKHSEYYAQNAAKQWKNVEWRRKMCTILSEYRGKLTRRLLEDKEFYNEWRQKSSILMKRLHNEGKLPINKGFKSTIMNTIKGGIFRTKSSYETAYAKMLDSNDNVEEFKYEHIYISYEHDGIMKTYIPDFSVQYFDGHVEIVEIKPHKLVDLEINQIKFKAAEKYSVLNGVEFVIISEDKLVSLS